MTKRRYDRAPRSWDRPPTRITSWPHGDGWVSVRIERARVRVFRVSTDEIPALIAELSKHVRPVTVTRLPEGGTPER
jgi:hypothetical protein